MIPAETRYETHDGKLLAIVEAFKTWRHYLESCKYEVLVLTDYNNLQRFMDTKNLSSRQVRSAQELSNTTSELIIGRAKLIELLMPCFDTPSGVLRKKRPSKPRIQRSCTNYNPHWLECQD